MRVAARESVRAASACRAVRRAHRARADDRRCGPARAHTIQFLRPHACHRSRSVPSRSCAATVALLTAQGSRRVVSLIVIGGTVLTENDARQILSPGARRHQRHRHRRRRSPARIAARYTAAQTIDARDQVVLPGLINTHTHAPMVMFRGLADDLALMDWLQKYIFPAEAKTVSPEFVRTGTRLAALEMIRVGHDDLRRHVLLRGGNREGDERGGPARRARADDHSVPGCRREDAEPKGWRGRKPSSRRSRTTR